MGLVYSKKQSISACDLQYGNAKLKNFKTYFKRVLKTKETLGGKGLLTMKEVGKYTSIKIMLCKKETYQVVISGKRHYGIFLILFFPPLSKSLPIFYSCIGKEANKIEQLKQWHLSSGAVQKPSERFINILKILKEYQC